MGVNHIIINCKLFETCVLKKCGDTLADTNYYILRNVINYGFHAVLIKVCELFPSPGLGNTGRGAERKIDGNPSISLPWEKKASLAISTY